MVASKEANEEEKQDEARRAACLSAHLGTLRRIVADVRVRQLALSRVCEDMQAAVDDKNDIRASNAARRIARLRQRRAMLSKTRAAAKRSSSAFLASFASADARGASKSIGMEALRAWKQSDAPNALALAAATRLSQDVLDKSFNGTAAEAATESC